MTSDDTQTAQVRAVRADVRRNRARLLAAARELFERDGAGGSLEGVARLAGVGIGTLYRHFPTRQDLLEALLDDVYADLTVRARELLESPAPGEAFTEWLRRFIAGTTAFPGMAASALVSLREGRPDPGTACRTARDAGEALFVRAQKAGDVPGDASFADALRLAGAIAVVTEHEPEAADRLLALATVGLLAISASFPDESE
ncbi:TetR/AcrR family transcriptional regulator [Actinomadura meridiana]|uniref:TetR/AcrR family transcriptional regulator n=1 Tax=Actinomadura meridiana TaxID=559626 RepID=A0ABP8BU31_9ACTN